MTDGSCPVCNAERGKPSGYRDGKHYDRECTHCGFRWVIYAKVSPGDHYVDISGIVAQAVRDALAIRVRQYTDALQAITEVEPAQIDQDGDDVMTWLTCRSCGHMQDYATEALQLTTQEATL